MCKSFDYDIIVICGLLNLANIHKPHRLLKFCAEKNNGNFLVVGLDENIAFKILNYRGSKENLMNLNVKIPEYAIITLDSEYFEEDIEDLRSSKGSRDHNSGCTFDDTVENVTISEYLQTHFLATTTGLKVSDNSFFNNSRIDISSSDFRFEHESRLSFQRTNDVDAFMGLFNGLELSNCLTSGGSIVKFKDFTKNKKESASLKKLFEDCKRK